MKRSPKPKQECLVEAAICRDDQIHRDAKSHAEIRIRLGDKDPYIGRMGDTEGFWTSEGRFLTRSDAKEVAILAGQLSPGWRNATRQLLSSDLDW